MRRVRLQHARCGEARGAARSIPPAGCERDARARDRPRVHCTAPAYVPSSSTNGLQHAATPSAARKRLPLSPQLTGCALSWRYALLCALQFGHIVMTTSFGIMDHEEARRKKTGGKILGFFY